MSRDGHIELDWAVDAIQVGDRVRQEVGDLTTLIESIRTHGLLQPITISPDGVLLCGARRLAAIRQLGLRTVSVWVRTGISTRLERLIAEQDENVLRQALLPTEAAALYRELKQILAEDAARRQEASRFGAPPGGSTGAAKSAAPRGGRDTRRQAARQVTGGNSYTRLEQIDQVRQAVDDSSLPEEIRRFAATALERMDADGKVDGIGRQVQEAVASARRQQIADLARDATTRAAAPTPAPATPAVPSRAARRLGVRAFLLTWNELADWSGRYDPAVIGPELTADQWDTFTRTVHCTVAFLERAEAARSQARALLPVR